MLLPDLDCNKVKDDSNEDMSHFEALQGCYWPNVKLKAPSADPEAKLGWRVEFRPCELQFTDFENAAFATFVVLLVRAALSRNLSFLVPISEVDADFEAAHERDAVRACDFAFRQNVAEPKERPTCRRMSSNEIINGSERFPGLASVVEEYLDESNVLTEVRITLDRYVSFLRKRASGEIRTNAAVIRQFVANHPAYLGDSVVSEAISYDLVKNLMSLETQGA